MPGRTDLFRPAFLYKSVTTLRKKDNGIKILDYMIAISFMMIRVSIDSTGL